MILGVWAVYGDDDFGLLIYGLLLTTEYRGSAIYLVGIIPRAMLVVKWNLLFLHGLCGISY